MHSDFTIWLDNECQKGLTDLKLTVLKKRGITPEAVQNELLMSEAAIKAGLLREPPKATSEIPADVQQVINNMR